MKDINVKDKTVETISASVEPPLHTEFVEVAVGVGILLVLALIILAFMGMAAKTVDESEQRMRGGAFGDG